MTLCLAVASEGETVADYAADAPYPSCLMLGLVNGRPLHVVVALDRGTGTCIVVTAYEPDAHQWNADFKTRRLE
jgi:hypothetical protein